MRYVQKDEPKPADGLQSGDEWFSPPRQQPFFHRVWIGGTTGWSTGSLGQIPEDLEGVDTSKSEESDSESDKALDDDTVKAKSGDDDSSDLEEIDLGEPDPTEEEAESEEESTDEEEESEDDGSNETEVPDSDGEKESSGSSARKVSAKSRKQKHGRKGR
jgi:hypothetical protein